MGSAMTTRPQILTEIGDIRHILDQAVDQLLSAAEHGLTAVRASPPDLTTLEAVLTAVLQIASFQDLVDQRLTRVYGLLQAQDVVKPTAPPPPPPSPLDADLLNGPALRGSGLDQAAADRLFKAD